MPVEPLSLDLPTGGWLVAPEFDTPELRQLLAEIHSLPRSQTAYLRYPGQTPGSEVFRVEAPYAGPAAALIVKRYGEFKLNKILKRLVRGSRGRRAFFWARELASFRIPALVPVAAGARAFRPWQSYFISAEVAPAVTLLDAALKHSTTSQRRVWLRALAQIMAHLHNAGISYGDAHLTNFLVHESTPPGQPLVLSDLDGLRRFYWITSRRAARDLRRLKPYTPATWTEQLRFIIEYCRFRNRPVTARKLIHEIGRSRNRKT